VHAVEIRSALHRVPLSVDLEVPCNVLAANVTTAPEHAFVSADRNKYWSSRPALQGLSVLAQADVGSVGLSLTA
jgi:hypothetical protein